MSTPKPARNATPAEAAFAQAVELHRQGRISQARSGYEKTLRLQPRHAKALYLLGAIALQDGDAEGALALTAKALAIDPRNAWAQLSQGVAELRLARPEAALRSFDAAIALSYPAADVHQYRGDALLALSRWAAALESYERAIALQADYAEALAGRGTALYQLRRLEAALSSYEASLALNPRNAVAHNNRGNVLGALGRYQAAVASYDTALSVQAAYADAHYNRGNALRELQRYEEAIASYDAAITLNPGLRYLRGVRRYAKMQICDWDHFEADRTEIEARIELGEEAANPFFLLAYLDSPALLQRSARIWSQEEAGSSALSVTAMHASPAKIRVGYFSADYHDHATMYLIAGLFEQHSRAQFEVSAFSYGAPSDDGMRRRLLSACDRFVDLRDQSDLQAAQLARQMRIDIAVDLKGFTQHGRPGIFAQRAAPVQVSYLGYPGTLGAAYIDYLVADPTLIPPGAEQYYDEKIIFLPHSYQINDDRRPIAALSVTRAALGLPQEGCVYCCFNNNYKITAEVFGCWLRILQAVEGSVLWLLQDNASAAQNLRRAAFAAGVDARRLIFAPRVAQHEHLARLTAADLFLDTSPCNAHTTASDALWAALPLLTCAGSSFAGRVAASLLHGVSLAQLITTSLSEYEQLAVTLGRDGARRAQLRALLAAGRRSAPLFNTALTVQHLEAAYAAIHARQRAGLPPQHYYVAPELVAAP